MLLPVIDYGSLLYTVAKNSAKNKLQLLINKGMRSTYFDGGTKNTVKLQKKGGVLSLNDRVDKLLHIESFKMSLCQEKLDIRNIHTRAHDQRLLKQKRVGNPAYRKSLEFRTVTKWNSLDVNIRKIDDMPSFRTWLDSFFKNKLESYIAH